MSMAEQHRTQEWGPHLDNGKPRNIPALTQFTGLALWEIKEQVEDFQRTNSNIDVDTIVNLLSRTLGIQRAELALTVFNQFDLMGWSIADVDRIVIKQDKNNKVKMGNGVGKGHLWYVIDWINPPEVIPAQVKQVEHPKEERHQKPTVMRLTPSYGGSFGYFFRHERVDTKKELDKKTETRYALDKLIMDTGRDIGDRLIEDGLAEITVVDGQALIRYKEKPGYSFSNVDRFSGQYNSTSYQRKTLDKTVLHYFETLARQAEGERVTYTPTQHSIEQCEEIFDQAKRAGSLRAETDSEGKKVFSYAQALDSVFFGVYGYSRMDLDKEIVEISYNTNVRTRHINPSFVEFLRGKKAEMDKASQAN